MRNKLNNLRKLFLGFSGWSPSNNGLDPEASTVLDEDRIAEVDEDNDLCTNLVVNSVRAGMKFSTLKTVLEEVWSRWGYPEKVTHDGSPPTILTNGKGIWWI